MDEQKVKALPRTILKYLVKAKSKLLNGLKVRKDLLSKVPGSYDFDGAEE